jgi:flagellin-like hook-associated protein FlgL
LTGIERTLLNRLAEANSAATLNALRLSTGKRILRPADSPSTFLTLSRFQSQLSNVGAAMNNVTAASATLLQVQSALGLIRGQLETMRAELLEDEERTLTDAERGAAQAKIDAAIEEINFLSRFDIGGRRLLDGSADFTILGRSSRQVNDVRVHGVVQGSNPTVSGEVLQTATRAEMVYTGSDGTVTDDAVFMLTGKRGAVSVTVDEGTDLDVLSQKINDYSHATGITASVEDDQLRLTSVDYGSRAKVSVDVTSGTFVVVGGDGSGTAYGTDAVATINGITYGGTTESQPAQLRHNEPTGLFASDAVIRLTGPLGSTDVTIQAGDTLDEVAAYIADQSGVTGVTATVEGADLVMKTVDRGSGAQVHFEVLSGDFDALTNYLPPGPATLTHHSSDGLITQRAVLRLSGNDGSRNVILNAGDTLEEAADAINAETSQTGIRAAVSGNDLLIQSVGTGPTAFAKITIISGNFDFEGGDATGTAYGINASASSRGVDAVEGRGLVNGNRFTINENGFRYEIEFAAGFTGDFNTMTVSGDALTFALSPALQHRSTLAIPSLHAWRLGGVSGRLDQLMSGGPLSGLDGNTSQALRVVDEAIAQLSQVEASVNGFYNSAVTVSSNLLRDLQDGLLDAVAEVDGYDQNVEAVLLAKNQELASNALAGLALLSQQRASLVHLIQQVAGLA